MKSTVVGALALTATIAALAGAYVGLSRYMDHVETEAHLAAVDARMKRDEPFLGVPLGKVGQHRIECPASGSTPVEVLVPMDGGTVGNPINADSFYVTPCVVDAGDSSCTGSVHKIRLGGSGAGTDNGAAVTNVTGVVVGGGCSVAGCGASAARDGIGYSFDAKDVRCISAGSSARQADVLWGRR